MRPPSMRRPNHRPQTPCRTPQLPTRRIRWNHRRHRSVGIVRSFRRQQQPLPAQRWTPSPVPGLPSAPQRRLLHVIDWLRPPDRSDHLRVRDNGHDDDRFLHAPIKGISSPRDVYSIPDPLIAQWTKDPSQFFRRLFFSYLLSPSQQSLCNNLSKLS